MRHPPSPLLLSARKRRPRRNPPRGAGLAPAGDAPSDADPRDEATGEKCALLEPDPAGEESGTTHGRGPR